MKTKVHAHGVTLLLSAHPAIRRLKRLHQTSLHGNRSWSSSWLLMDFLGRQQIPEGMRLMDVGCGWGLAGIYCAKRLKAVVTSVDIDEQVFPYLNLHAAVNKVEITPMKKSFGGLAVRDLSGFHLLIGADICFWDQLGLALKRMINRALKAGVRMVLIADPGRPTFDELGEYFAKKQGAETVNWSINSPRQVEGRILKIGALS